MFSDCGRSFYPTETLSLEMSERLNAPQNAVDESKYKLTSSQPIYLMFAQGN